jgi:hypothetical protein
MVAENMVKDRIDIILTKQHRMMMIVSLCITEQMDEIEIKHRILDVSGMKGLINRNKNHANEVQKSQIIQRIDTIPSKIDRFVKCLIINNVQKKADVMNICIKRTKI